MPLAVITFEFDPLLHLGDWSVRWETLGIGAAILVALIVAGWLAGRGRSPTGPDLSVAEAGPSLSTETATIEPLAHDGHDHLRREDVLFIALGVVPGAMIGGRIAYVLLHLDYYSAFPSAIVDPVAGGLALSGAVVLGALTGGIVARLFEAPVGRWYTLAVVPMLLVLGLGKAANVLGGTGQGVPSVTETATRYLGPGPWGSLGADIPSLPAQLYEAIGVGIVLVILVAARLAGRLTAVDGRLFALALGCWAIVRFVVAGTWRDATVVASLNAEQLLDIGIFILAVAIFIILVLRARRRPTTTLVTAAPAVASVDQVPTPPDPGRPPATDLNWPDPETRRRF